MPEETAQRPSVLSIEGGRVALGPLRAELVDEFHRWHNDQTAQYFGGFPEPPGPRTWQQTERWLRGEVEREAEDRFWFVVYETARWRPIGHANIRDVDPRHRTAEWGLTIGDPADRGQGYGTAATQLLMRFAFERLGVHNLWADVFAYNEAGLRAYRKAGFREIGRRREAHYAGGRLWDVVLLDAVATEHAAKKPKTPGGVPG